MLFYVQYQLSNTTTGPDSKLNLTAISIQPFMRLWILPSGLKQ